MPSNYLIDSSYASNYAAMSDSYPLIPSRYAQYPFGYPTTLNPTLNTLNTLNNLNNLSTLSTLSSIGQLSPYSPVLSTVVTPVVGPVGATVIIPGPYQLPAPLDLNKDSRIHKQVTKYFRYKILDKWLYEEMSDILGYFKVSGENVELIKNISDVGKQNHSDQDVEKIINYMEKNILTEDTTSRIIHHFVKSAKANWYDLHKNEYFVKDIFHKKIISILSDTITQK